MLVKDIISTDFTNYKKPSMYIAFPYCSFKCEKECGLSGICQNSPLALQKNLEISITRILELYDAATYGGTEALLCCGLEPLDSWPDLQELVTSFRQTHLNDIVIYTGYTEDEISDKVAWLKQFKNIIIKFGRFRPNSNSHYDEVLGITLVSENQYGKKIS